MEKFVNHTHYSADLMLEAYKEFFKVKHKKRNIVSLVFATLILIASTIYLYEAIIGRQPFKYNYVIFIFISFGLIWSAFWGYTSVARRTYDGMIQNGLSRDLKYKFKDDRFEVDNENEVFDIKWTQCIFSVQTEHLCLIAVNKKFYAVDLQGFKKGSSKDFLKLVEGKTVMIKSK